MKADTLLLAVQGGWHVPTWLDRFRGLLPGHRVASADEPFDPAAINALTHSGRSSALTIMPKSSMTQSSAVVGCDSQGCAQSARPMLFNDALMMPVR